MPTRLRQSCLFAGVLIALPLVGEWNRLHADYISDPNLPVLRVEAPVFFPQDTTPIMPFSPEARRDTEPNTLPLADWLASRFGAFNQQPVSMPESFVVTHSDSTPPQGPRDDSLPQVDRPPTPPQEGLGSTGTSSTDGSGGGVVGLAGLSNFVLNRTPTGVVRDEEIHSSIHNPSDLFHPPRAG